MSTTSTLPAATVEPPATAQSPLSTNDEVRDLLADSLRNGTGTDGFAKAIAECGSILEKDFPIKADDIDELPNNLRVI